MEPIYMPGRFRTASRPSRTWISEASYSLDASTAVEFKISLSAIYFSFAVLFLIRKRTKKNFIPLCGAVLVLACHTATESCFTELIF